MSYIIFLISAQAVLTNTTIYILSRNNENIRIFYLKIFIYFLVVKFSIYLNRRVFLMAHAKNK